MAAIYNYSPKTLKTTPKSIDATDAPAITSAPLAGLQSAFPGAEIGGSGLTGLASNDLGGYASMMNRQRISQFGTAAQPVHMGKTEEEGDPGIAADPTSWFNNNPETPGNALAALAGLKNPTIVIPKIHSQRLGR